MELEKVYFNHNCNTYILGNKGDFCVVIDPGFNKNNCLVNYIKKFYKGVKAVLLTHVHYDHILGLEDIYEEFNCDIYCHENDIDKIYEPFLNCSTLINIEVAFDSIKPIPLSDNQILDFFDTKIKVIHTPFHTSGSVCYYIDSLKTVLTGDTLFHLEIGRFDLPTSSIRTIYSSLAKLKQLPIETKVLPGHGESTTIENELKFNRSMKK